MKNLLKSKIETEKLLLFTTYYMRVFIHKSLIELHFFSDLGYTILFVEYLG